MKRLNPFEVAWDAWRAAHGGPKAIAAHQRARLSELIAFARARSGHTAIFTRTKEYIAAIEALSRADSIGS